MPSSEYYRRQADTALALALATSDPELSAWCRNLAIEYKLLSEKGAAGSVPCRPDNSAPIPRAR
jgi:hypothetical protein